MKKVILTVAFSITALAAQAQTVTLRGSEVSDYKLAMASFERAKLAEKHKDYLTACIHYRTSGLHMISVGPKMDTNIKNLKIIETAICKKAGV